jgi:hypothetical protein
MNALDAFGLFVLSLFRRAPTPVPLPAVPVDDDPLAELREALERQIVLDESKRRRWGDHG